MKVSSLLALVLGAVALSACSSSTSPTGPTALQITDLVVGTGATAAVGDTLTVNYIGSLQNGTEFESSYRSGVPFTFRLGVGAVIPGWDQGIVGMRVGGKRQLVIPPSLAYGSQANGPIPANSTLQFTIELIGLAK